VNRDSLRLYNEARPFLELRAWRNKKVKSARLTSCPQIASRGDMKAGKQNALSH
jgi:hypothetical protein